MINHNFPSLLKNNLGRKMTAKEAAPYLATTEQEASEQFQQLHRLSKQKKELQFLFSNDLLQLDELKNHWFLIFFNTPEKQIIYTDVQRKKGIFLTVFTTTLDTSVYLLQDLFNISKNTVLADIKELRRHLQKKRWN